MMFDWRRFVGIGAAGLVIGCGQTSIHEKHVFQANDVRGHVAYYRVAVEGRARLAKATYRAGLYDAAAVDALFGTTSESDTEAVDQTLERHRRQAVDLLAKAYYDALAAGKGGDPAALQALQKAITPVARPRKFVIIHSANASAVEAAIADFTDERDTHPRRKPRRSLRRHRARLRCRRSTRRPTTLE